MKKIVEFYSRYGTQTLDFRDLKDWLVVNEMLFYESKHYNLSARGDDGSQVVEGIVQTRKQSVIIRAVMGMASILTFLEAACTSIPHFSLIRLT